jgi:hypothetical protein
MRGRERKSEGVRERVCVNVCVCVRERETFLTKSLKALLLSASTVLAVYSATFCACAVLHIYMYINVI